MTRQKAFVLLSMVPFGFGACDEPLRPEPEPTTPAVMIMGQTMQTNGTPMEGVTVLFAIDGCKRAALADSVVSDANGNFVMRLEQLKNAQDLDGQCEITVTDHPALNSGFVSSLGFTYLRFVHFRYPVTDTFRLVRRLPREQFHSIGHMIYSECVGWVDKPETDRVVVDILFDQIPEDELVQRRFVEAHGARILQSLNVPGYRVDIPADSIPPIGEGTRDNLLNIWTVPDFERTDLRIWVSFDRKVTYADARQLEALGARVLYWYRNEDGFIIDIANDALPAVRNMDGFVYMTPDLTFCAAA